MAHDTVKYEIKDWSLMSNAEVYPTQKEVLELVVYFPKDHGHHEPGHTTFLPSRATTLCTSSKMPLMHSLLSLSLRYANA
jgi:hypothetical protein